MAKAKKKPQRPRATKEPTTAQLRQEYYAHREEARMLEELGLKLDDRPAPKGDATFWVETRDALDRLEIVHAVWRWAGMTGYAPEPEDWDVEQGWPSASEVEQVFGSWDKMLDESRIDDAIFGELVTKLLDSLRGVKAREAEIEGRARRLEEDAKRIPELKRREEVAREKREQADAARQEAEAARDAVVRERDALSARVAELSEEVASLRAQISAEPAAPAEEELLVEMEAALAAQAQSQHARDELHERVERLRAEREQDRRTIAELTRLVSTLDASAGAEVEEVAVEEPPVTVLEAVERAARDAQHLRFAPKAFETAAESPFRRPGLVLKTLRSLDDLAGRFAQGDMGKSLVQAAADHGITQWKHDVAETTRKRYEDDYSFSFDGKRLWVGPHIGLGSGSGAGFVARIYLHVSDGGEEVPRGITVAVVGRHLPDTTT